MIVAFKIAMVTGITAFLAYCVTTGTVQHTVHKHHKKHHKTVHEYYAPTPTLSPTYTAIPSPKPVQTSPPQYKTTTHQHPPWSPNYKPD